jgi:hypothetical protein
VGTVRAIRGGKGTPKGEGSLDPFTMQDDSEYSPDNVYNRSTDGHGHNVNLQTRVAPDIAGEINALVASQVIPEYRTSADVVRDALVHRLYHIAQRTKNGDLERRITIEMRLARLDAWRAEMANMERLLGEQTEALQKALDLLDLDMMERLLQVATENVEVMRDPYAQNLKDQIKSFRAKYRRAVTDQARNT